MRDIKFRAWDKLEKVMYNVNVIDLKYKTFLELENSETKSVISIPAGVFDNHFILMQFADFKDLDWWEGDILEVETVRVSKGANWYQEVSKYDGGCRARCVIIFKNGKFQLDWGTPYNKQILKQKGKETCERTFFQYIHYKRHSKKLGNIHENPELLEINQCQRK